MRDWVTKKLTHFFECWLGLGMSWLVFAVCPGIPETAVPELPFAIPLDP
jgi:hypothetical protein